MNDWKIIWNNFCNEVSVSVKKNNLEKVFEEDIAREFFRALEWYRLNQGLTEQYPIRFATVTHRADFALFVPDKESPEIIVELKRPKKKKEEKDAKQLIDYMKQKSCSYGILLLGDKLEIYYIDYSKPQHEASLVETVKYQHDNDAARQFMEVLNRSTYDSAHMLEYCHKRVKINKSVEYWCSVDGKKEILNMIIERSQLPEHLLDTLRSTLIVDVRRRDGLAPISQQPVVKVVSPISQTPAGTNTQKSVKRRKGNDLSPRTWIIPASSKFFNHKACFEEQGYIYWTQYFNFKAGDTVYIYFTRPTMRILYKCEVVHSAMPYSQEMDAEIKYYKNATDFEKPKAHNRFFMIKLIAETTSDDFTLKNLLANGMKGAPMGALNLSDESFDELRTYIVERF